MQIRCSDHSLPRLALALLFPMILMGRSALAQQPAVNSAGTMHHLLPIPASVEFQPGQLRLDANFSVASTGVSDSRLDHAVQRMLKRLAAQASLSLVQPRAKDAAHAILVLRADAPGMKIQGIEEDESYALEVTPQQANLHAPTVVGVLRGLETLLQLVQRDPGGSYLPAVRIQDRPRFAWRGLMIDVCRHWEPIEVVKRNLDAMAVVKLNVFHWHLSEDQGFRVESKRFPKLQELGSDGLYYTQDQIRDVVAYAHDRGIRVVPEFDMPGHASSWFVGYPEYSSGTGPYAIERRFGVFDPTFDPTREAVYKFLDRFVGEMAALFPDAYWHIGGDENNGHQWTANPAIQEFMHHRGIKDNAALQAYFSQRLAKILQKHGKRMIGWDEILHGDLPKDTVVQSWRGQASLAAGAKQGFRGILSAGYYLDGMATSAAYYAVDPLPATSDLTPEEAARILGGEVCMWGELITPETIDSRIWPRTAAVAERLWSSRDVKDVPDLYRRLDPVSVELEDVGAKHLSGPEVMLRRLAGTEEIAPLRELLRAVEPVSLSERQRTSRATQLTSLTTLGDIVVPDAPLRHELANLVGEALGNDAAMRDSARAALAAEFARWRALPPKLAALVDRSRLLLNGDGVGSGFRSADHPSPADDAPLLRDAGGVAADLAALGDAGDEALAFLAQGATPLPGWLDAKRALLDQAAKSKNLLRVAVVDPMRTLITAVSSSGSPGTGVR